MPWRLLPAWLSPWSQAVPGPHSSKKSEVSFVHRYVLLCKGETDFPCIILLCAEKLNGFLTVYREEENNWPPHIQKCLRVSVLSYASFCETYFSFFLCDIENVFCLKPESVNSRKENITHIQMFPSVFTNKSQQITFSTRCLQWHTGS